MSFGLPFPCLSLCTHRDHHSQVARAIITALMMKPFFYSIYTIFREVSMIGDLASMCRHLSVKRIAFPGNMEPFGEIRPNVSYSTSGLLTPADLTCFLHSNGKMATLHKSLH
jgi:hypothetical protein